MPQRWLYAEGEQVSGPVTPRELKNLASNGTITPSTWVRLDDLQAKWVEARKVKGLFTTATAAQSPHESLSPQDGPPPSPYPQPSPVPEAPATDETPESLIGGNAVAGSGSVAKEPMDSSLETEILSLLKRDCRIGAIKLCRERMKVELKEAKELVEAVALRTAELPAQPGPEAGSSPMEERSAYEPMDSLLEQEITALLGQALDLCSSRLGIGMDEARGIIEAMAARISLPSIPQASEATASSPHRSADTLPDDQAQEAPATAPWSESEFEKKAQQMVEKLADPTIVLLNLRRRAAFERRLGPPLPVPEPVSILELSRADYVLTPENEEGRGYDLQVTGHCEAADDYDYYFRYRASVHFIETLTHKGYEPASHGKGSVKNASPNQPATEQRRSSEPDPDSDLKEDAESLLADLSQPAKVLATLQLASDADNDNGFDTPRPIAVLDVSRLRSKLVRRDVMDERGFDVRFTARCNCDGNEVIWFEYHGRMRCSETIDWSDKPLADE